MKDGSGDRAFVGQGRPACTDLRSRGMGFSRRIGKTFETGGSNLSLSAAPGACSRTSGRDGQATRQLVRGIPRRGEAFHRVHDMAQPKIFYCYTLAEEQSLPK